MIDCSFQKSSRKESKLYLGLRKERNQKNVLSGRGSLNLNISVSFQLGLVRKQWWDISGWIIQHDGPPPPFILATQMMTLDVSWTILKEYRKNSQVHNHYLSRWDANSWAMSRRNSFSLCCSSVDIHHSDVDLLLYQHQQMTSFVRSRGRNFTRMKRNWQNPTQARGEKIAKQPMKTGSHLMRLQSRLKDQLKNGTSIQDARRKENCLSAKGN